MRSQEKKSSALFPWQWVVAIVACLCLAAMYFRVEPWVMAAFIGTFVFVLLIGAVVFCFFAVKSPECLRSEKFHQAYAMKRLDHELAASADGEMQKFNPSQISTIRVPALIDGEGNNADSR